LKIYSNERVRPKDFSMKYECSFCDKFNSKVLELPEPCGSLICKTCLGNMAAALDTAMMEEMREGRRNF
jgi:transcription elongation factor Elf1